MHATAAAAARQLPGVCTFALEATKQRENANWSRIGQLTRSGQVGFGFAKVRVILGHFLAVSENSEPRGAGPAASEAVWTAERTNVFNKLYLQIDSRLLPRRGAGGAQGTNLNLPTVRGEPPPSGWTVHHSSPFRSLKPFTNRTILPVEFSKA